MTAIESACESLCDELGIELAKLIIDSSSAITLNSDIKLFKLQSIQFHSARLCFTLHCFPFKRLGLVSKRKRQRQAKNQ